VRVLAIDTTAPPGSLALVEDGIVRLEGAVQDGRPFGECLPGVALDALGNLGWSLHDVDLFAIGSGPGSLTGLRVGIATAQGFAFACGKPLVGVSALEALASVAATKHPGHTVVAWSDARRGEVFAHAFVANEDRELESIEGPLVSKPDTLAARWVTLSALRPLIVIGNAARTHEALWASLTAGRVLLLDAPVLAPAMAALGTRAAAQGHAGPPHALTPLYVRRPDAELARERSAATATASQFPPQPSSQRDERR
jgi:tRNA threonylcarbamoyladenosine biosynthesis protein TsaB